MGNQHFSVIFTTFKFVRSHTISQFLPELMSVEGFDKTNCDYLSIFHALSKKFSFKGTIKNLSFLAFTDIKDIVNEIESYGKNTGIMIGNIQLAQDYLLYLIIFDRQIIIIDESDFEQLQPFFKKINDNTPIFFMNSECEKEFKKMKLKNSDNIEKPKAQEIQTDFSQKIKKQISNCIILKSRIRTINRHNLDYEPTKNKFIFDDFISIFYIENFAYVYFNIKDQFLYVLKLFNSNNEESNNRYNHELSFYENCNNKNPFICRYYGKMKHQNNDIIIIEYIEGETLKKFILNKKRNLEKIDKIKIIIEIMSAIEFMHLNNIMYRDLKINNIIIDSNGNAVLIDFDQSRIIDGTPMTTDIGSYKFTPKEQSSSNNYSFPADVYSLGIIIHFIFTEKKELNNFTEIPSGYEKFYKNYKNCFDNSPELRPKIGKLLNSFFIRTFHKNKNDLFFTKLFNIRNELFDNLYEQQTKNENLVDLYVFLGYFFYYGYFNFQDINKSIQYLTFAADQKDLDAQYYLGEIYYLGEYIPLNINKAIYYLTIASNQNDPDAQFYLGEIYYLDQDIDKSIYYLTLSSNQNNVDAQYLLGKIYYQGIYIPRDISKSIHYLSLSSEQNNSDAQFYLGVLYYIDEYIARDIKKAIYYLNLSSDQNNPNAQCLLGEIYSKGEYISRDINKAIKYLTVSSNQNYPYAQFLLGEIYYNGEYISQDVNKGFYYLSLSANQNFSEAQYFLGVCYYRGDHIQRNINKSIQYLTLSSNQNHSKAQFYLGLIYYKGDKTIQDISKAVYYLTLSSDQKNSNAQFVLGIIYYEGQYIKRDINKSIHYLVLSSNQGNSDAQFLLGEIYHEGQYIKRDINKSIYYFTLSSNQNNSNSQFFLGVIYYLGEHIPRDINKSIELLTISSNQQNSIAQFYLGVIYYLGKYIPRDINKAIYYLTMSSNQYNPKAQCVLGFIYYEGKYIQQNINKSIYYFTLSAQQNISDAQYYLGEIYYNGKYITRDVNKAIYYLTLSANQNDSDAQFCLGVIYYNGKYISRDINKAVQYFKNSSCFYNYKAKNNLGVIYKNGDGVKKNIYHAIEYFEEAIKLKNDSYSLFNLSKIYYFAIEIERNVPKSIELLEQLSNNRFILADLFLYYIYLTIDKEKSAYYLNKNEALYNISAELNDEKILSRRLQLFFSKYDLVYTGDENYLDDLVTFLKFESFQKYDESKCHFKNLRIDITKEFYDGFYSK